LVALQYFVLGDDPEAGHRYLADYYGELSERIWPGVAKDPEALQAVIRRFEEIGADELILSPIIASLEQAEMLARAVL
jgi:hypothetical protein